MTDKGEREGRMGEAENNREAKKKSRDQKEEEGTFPRKEKLEQKAIKCQTVSFPQFTLFQLTDISWDQFVDLRGYSHFSLLSSLGTCSCVTLHLQVIMHTSSVSKLSTFLDAGLQV